MMLMTAFIQQPGERAETRALAGGHGGSSSAVIPRHPPFCFFKNMSASPRWLAVRMCCVFVLDLMPNLLSNNDCTGSVSDEKSKGKEEWALIPHYYSRTGSQQELYVWFWHFLNVVSETCQSPWFNMACCCSSSPGAYIKSVPVRGDLQYVSVYIPYWFCCVEIHVCLFEINTCKETMRYTFRVIDTRGPEGNPISGARLKMEPSLWCRLAPFWSTNGRWRR